MLASVNSSVVAAAVSEPTAAVSVRLAVSFVPRVSDRPRHAPATDASTRRVPGMACRSFLLRLPPQCASALRRARAIAPRRLP